MTLKELKEWVKSASYNDTVNQEYDGNGNNFRSIIYKKDGKLYRIDYCNGEPNEVMGENGYIRGMYQPREVTRHVKRIERVYYKLVEKAVGINFKYKSEAALETNESK